MKGLFFGLITVDLHFFVDHYPVENSKVKAKAFKLYTGGPATNASITYQFLGGTSNLITAIGKNAFTTMMLSEAAQCNLELIDLQQDTHFDPVFASILTNIDTGDRTAISYMPQLVHSDTDLSGYPSSDTNIALFDGFYIDSAIEVAKKCKEQNICTVLDGGSWKNNTDELLKYIDIAICSSDFTPPGTVRHEDTIEYLFRKGVKKVAITRGDHSIIYNDGTINMKMEVPDIKAIDSLGAGDIFHGAFCYYYSKSGKFKKSLKKAAEVAAFSCQFEGTRKWMEHWVK